MRIRRATPAPTTPIAESPTPDRHGSAPVFPSIWVGSFRDQAEWEADVDGREAMFSVFDGIDDKMMSSRHPFDITGWCAACEAVRPMAMAWHLGAIDSAGSVNPAWSLNACCHECGLVSRIRALIDFLRSFPTPVGSSFVAERVTPAHTVLQRMFPNIVGSEFLGDDHVGGREYRQESGALVRHEDMTSLSFGDDQLDLMITQDVFEHVPDYPRAFSECRRVLRSGGRLVFTVPFFAHLATTEVRATVDPDGNVTHILSAEIHGNPVGEGSLCFQHFGWDLLDHLRAAGFQDALAHMYWGPWGGHLGFPSFVFEAGG